MPKTIEFVDRPTLADPRYTPIRQWASLAGRWDFDRTSDHCEYTGSALISSVIPEDPTLPFGVALAAGRFRDGVVKTRMTVVASGREQTPAQNGSQSWSEGITGGLLFGFQNLQTQYFVAHMGGFNRAYGIQKFDPGMGWRPVISAGLAENLDVGAEYELALELVGQSVTMLVNGVEVVSNFSIPDAVEGHGFGLFAWGRGKLVFRQTEIAAQAPRVFIVMPFSEPYETLYTEVIQKVVKKERFEPIRVDEIRGPGNVLEDIRRQIASAHVVVAEISSPNPNVFYEVGYAHALNKPVILLARRDGDQALPFDLRPYRVIFYDDTIGGKTEVERALRDHLKAVMR